MKKWLYVFDNPKDDVYEKPKFVYNKENNAIVPEVGDETSDKVVRNASDAGNASEDDASDEEA
jgi:hypothetical protein